VADQQFDDLLRSLERSAEPEEAFADALYEQLATEAGFRGGAATGTLGGVRLGWSRLRGPMRLVWIVVVLALMAAVAIGMVVVGGGRSAEDIVRRSQALVDAPPPFSMTTRFDDGSEARYLFNGTTLRLEVTKGRFFGELPEGWFFVTDADRIGRYDPEANSWGVSDNPDGWALHQLQPSWVAPTGYGPGEEPPLVTCDAWELGEVTEVAGRTADEVRCGERRYWIDRDSGLLVKREDASFPDSPVTEVIALEINPILEAGLFAFEPPPGSGRDEDPQPLHPDSDVLTVGEAAPELTGTLVDGSSFSTDDLHGRPAAIFFWCVCAPGAQVRTFLSEASLRADVMSLVLVSLEREGATQGLVDWLGVETPVVDDAQWTGFDTWRLSYFPAMVLLRADGTVADLQAATFSPATLDAILDALLAGAPIPEPDPWPERITDAEGRVPLSTVLEVGEVAPELRGPSLGGGELSTTDLLGKPTVVLQFWHPPDPALGPQDDVPSPDLLLSEVAARGTAFNVLFVAVRVPSSDAVPLYLEGQAVQPQVMFDWDGMLLRRWGLVTSTLVLLDAEGRVAGYYGAMETLNDPGPLLDALEAGEPLPTPYPPGL
jgi:hypothetical protein